LSAAALATGPFPKIGTITEANKAKVTASVNILLDFISIHTSPSLQGVNKRVHVLRVGLKEGVTDTIGLNNVIRGTWLLTTFILLLKNW
jgi:hypothetical protein